MTEPKIYNEKLKKHDPVFRSKRETMDKSNEKGISNRVYRFYIRKWGHCNCFVSKIVLSKFSIYIGL